jgi:hypothetical protein
VSGVKHIRAYTGGGEHPGTKDPRPREDETSVWGTV